MQPDHTAAVTAKELREAYKLWPQCLQWGELQAELEHHGQEPEKHPIALRMLRDEVARRQTMSVYAYDKHAESFGIVVDSPSWFTLAAAAIGTPRPCGPCRTASVRCESGKRNYCTCDTCF